MEVITFDYIDKADPMQAETYLVMKLRSFFRMLSSTVQKPTSKEIIQEGEKILKAHEIIKRKYPFIANRFVHQISMVKEEIEKAVVIGGGANE